MSISEIIISSFNKTYSWVSLWSCYTGLVVNEPLGSLPGPAGNLLLLQGNASVPGVKERL